MKMFYVAVTGTIADAEEVAIGCYPLRPYSVIKFEALDSTNRYGLSHLRDLSHGTVVQAKVQTEGRGRWKRSWISDVPGNLALSIILKPDPACLPHAPALSHLLAVCLCRILDRYNVQAGVKWPNDVLVGSKKIAGILAESSTSGTKLAGIVLGIGVNLNLEREHIARVGRPATALNLETGQEVEVDPVRDGVLQEFFAEYEPFMQQGFTHIRDEYLQRCGVLGQPVELRDLDTVLRGTALNVDEEGALVLRTEDGNERTVRIGEIFAL